MEGASSSTSAPNPTATRSLIRGRFLPPIPRSLRCLRFFFPLHATILVKMVCKYPRGGCGEDPGTPLFDQRANLVINPGFCSVPGEQPLPLAPQSLVRRSTAMRIANAPRELLPEGLYLASLSIGTERVGIRVASEASRSRCPVCGLVSSRVHSRYWRTVSDLPWHGISVTLEVRARRFFCDEASCGRRIFCERLPEIAARARKTDRLEQALLAIALELGGRAGARLAEELGIVAARDTLLRRVKGAPLREVGKVKVLGVDDFAFKKGSTYGTILVDLELHKVVDLLPERSQGSLVAWFESHPGAEVEVAT